MKSVCEYLDYREFLKDFYNERKTYDTWFSYRVFAEKVGLDSSYLAKVIMGARHLASRSIEAVAQYCGLDDNERDYFRMLVAFGKAKTDHDSKLYFEKMLDLKGGNARKLTADQYAFYKTWYIAAIRALLEYYPFYGKRYGDLGAQLNPVISAKQARESIGVLKRLGLIVQDSNGRYTLTENSVTTGQHWHSLAITSYQKTTIRLSEEAIERHSREHRDISTLTLNIDAKDFEEIRERIRQFRQSLISFVSERSDPDRTYQMNIQLVPLSRLPENKERS